jgi:hypothetical protein
MGLRSAIKSWLYPPKYDPEVIVEDVKAKMGYTKGGIYAGITFIPGDPNKPWEEGEDCISSCPACDGVMRSIYQTSNEEQDGEFIRYYKTVCKECNLLYDTGRKMTKREVRASQYVYCDVVKGETFNRTGRNCCFIYKCRDMVDVCTKLKDCEECPHPH